MPKPILSSLIPDQPPATSAFPPDTKKDAVIKRLFNQNGGEIGITLR